MKRLPTFRPSRAAIGSDGLPSSAPGSARYDSHDRRPVRDDCTVLSFVLEIGVWRSPALIS